MNTKVTAEIDVATPTGQRIFKELAQHYTHQEIWEMVEKRMSDHYGVEIKFD